jgi:hypothetical protein
MFKLQLILLFYLILLSSIVYNQFLDNDLDYSAKNTTDSDDQLYVNENTCPPRGMVDEIKYIVLPDDFDEQVNDIPLSIKSIDEYENIIRRLSGYRHNVSEKLSEITKLVGNEAKDILLTLNVSSDCMTSIFRIINGIQNSESWAFSCM